MDEIPVSNRDIHDQVVFRDPVSETQPENGMVSDFRPSNFD